jgi:hypothetical protein
LRRAFPHDLGERVSVLREYEGRRVAGSSTRILKLEYRLELGGLESLGTATCYRFPAAGVNGTRGCTDQLGRRVDLTSVTRQA